MPSRNVLPTIVVLVIIFISLRSLAFSSASDTSSSTASGRRSAARNRKLAADEVETPKSRVGNAGRHLRQDQKSGGSGVSPDRASPPGAYEEPPDDPPATSGVGDLSDEISSLFPWSRNPLASLNRTFDVPDDAVHDPAGPRPDQIVLLTATDGKGHNGGIADIVSRATANREEYCSHHGYVHHFVNISRFDLARAHPVWKKLPAIVDAFNAHPAAQWVWVLDLDAIIMTPSVDLRALLLSEAGMRKNLLRGEQFHGDDWSGLGVWTSGELNFRDVDFIIAQDHNGVNAGSFFVRRSKFTQFFVDMWGDPFFMMMEWHNQEQEAILHMIKHHPVFRQHLGLMRQRVANAFSEGGPTMKWHDGDLVVHLAGCWVMDTCSEKWEEYWAKRGRVPSKASGRTPAYPDHEI